MVCLPLRRITKSSTWAYNSSRVSFVPVEARISTIIGIITSCQLRRRSDSVPSKSKMAALNGPRGWRGLMISIGGIFDSKLERVRPKTESNRQARRSKGSARASSDNPAENRGGGRAVRNKNELVSRGCQSELELRRSPHFAGEALARG